MVKKIYQNFNLVHYAYTFFCTHIKNLYLITNVNTTLTVTNYKLIIPMISLLSTSMALRTANTGPTVILSWAAASRCLSQDLLMLHWPLVPGLRPGEVKVMSEVLNSLSRMWQVSRAPFSASWSPLAATNTIHTVLHNAYSVLLLNTVDS